MRTLFIFLIILSFQLKAQVPQAAFGKVERLEMFSSKFVEARNVDIWLPEGYSDTQKYAVLYMHDGQMLFDSTNTWNKCAWDVDDVLSRLLQEQKIRNVIVVGIWNAGKSRHSDYFPQKPFESLKKAEQDSVLAARRTNGASVFQGYKVNSDSYLAFLVEELKPYIDKHYSTLTDRDNTFVAGSSMGGLISMYAICQYPKIFGGAACLSTHWPGIFITEGNPVPGAFVKYLKRNLPNPKTHKIYFDHGTATLDAMYPAIQQNVDIVMRRKGYKPSHWITRSFEGEDHSERAWRKRLHIPMLFLLGR